MGTLAPEAPHMGTHMGTLAPEAPHMGTLGARVRRGTSGARVPMGGGRLRRKSAHVGRLRRKSTHVGASGARVPIKYGRKHTLQSHDLLQLL